MPTCSTSSPRRHAGEPDRRHAEVRRHWQRRCFAGRRAGRLPEQLAARDVLTFDVPFVKGENLSALDDFGSLFAAKLTSDMASNGYDSWFVRRTRTAPAKFYRSAPSFASAQELAAKLATALGLTRRLRRELRRRHGRLDLSRRARDERHRESDARRPGYRRAAGRHDQRPGRADRDRHPRFHLRHRPVAVVQDESIRSSGTSCRGRGARGEHHDVVADPHRRFRPFRTSISRPGRAPRGHPSEEEPEGPTTSASQVALREPAHRSGRRAGCSDHCGALTGASQAGPDFDLSVPGRDRHRGTAWQQSDHHLVENGAQRTDGC